MPRWDTAAIVERKRRVAALTAEGRSAVQIASELGIAPRTVIRDRRDTGVASEPPRPLSADEIAKIEAMLDDGCSYAEIARTIGRNVDWIARKFPGRGWNRTAASQFGGLMQHMRQFLPGI